MADTTFTPGPWRLAEMAVENGLFMNDGGLPVLSGKPQDEEGRRICVVDAVDPPRKDAYKHKCAERDANARLIAVAPDMYAALVLARNLIGPDEIIDAAIAKAVRS